MNPALALDAPELVSAATVAKICNKDARTIRMRMADVEPARVDERGTKWWRIDQLPTDYQVRIEQAKIIKGFARAEDIVNWQGRAAAMFHWTLDQLTDDEQKRWPVRKLALREYYACIESGLTSERAEQRACDVWKHEMGTTVDPRTIRNWREPVEKCGGPEHAPDEAYSIWRRQKKGTPLNPATIRWFNSLLTDNQRKFYSAYREALLQLDAWRAGDPSQAVPGYTAPPPNAAGKKHPYRWTRYYLCGAKRRPTPRVITLSRIGHHAADDILSILRNKRTGTKVGQFYFFDDQEYDEKTNLLGINKIGTRPLGLDCADFTSSCLCAQLFIPTLWNDEDKKREKIKGWHMPWFACHVLTEIGYRRDENGTTFYVESGTAALEQAFRDRVALVTGGKVKVISGHPDKPAAFSGVFEGASKGNPRVKAVLESWRNRQRNDMANRLEFPAQTGMDRDHQPEDLIGRDKYNNWLLKNWEEMPADLRDLFDFPVNEFSVFVEKCIAYTERINCDEEHRLQDWIECGFTTREWRLDDDDLNWKSVDKFRRLSPERQAIVHALLEGNDNLTQVRKLTRREVFEAGKGDLVKVPVWDIPRLMGPEFGRVLNVTKCGRFIKFQDKDIDPYDREFVFLARMEDRAEHQANLTAGAAYKCYLNPLRPDRLIICQLNGGFLGVCHAIDGVMWNEHEKRQKLMAMQTALGQEARHDLEMLGVKRTEALYKKKMSNAGAAAPREAARTKQASAAAKGLAKLYTDDA